MRQRFQASRVTDVLTGVDLDYLSISRAVRSRGGGPGLRGIHGLAPEHRRAPVVCRGDSATHSQEKAPGCSVVVVGRRPTPDVEELAARSSGLVKVTGTVPDIRPYLWGSSVAIVPLRIGGGTRLKIYESMAAGVPFVSTPIGAEGLACRNGRDICLADSPEAFKPAPAWELEQAGIAAADCERRLRIW